jgi:ABC-type amino acid transport substrate-binding protein
MAAVEVSQPVLSLRELGGFAELRAASDAVPVSIATLGPAGTSSEAAARRAGELLMEAVGRSADVELHPSFEGAADAVRAGDADAVVVANAYSRINDVYMDPELRLSCAFVMPTPDYGIAARPGAPVPLATRLTTHPAPRRLIAELLPPGFVVRETLDVASTSEAARMVAEGEADLALTNEPSIVHHHLRFVSRTRPILMLWSVFTRGRRAVRARP